MYYTDCFQEGKKIVCKNDNARVNVIYLMDLA